MSPPKRAVILLSGGLDSATVLGVALDQGYECYPLSFRYGQRHTHELDAASALAKHYQLKHHVVLPVDLSLWGGSSLTDHTLDVPDANQSKGIPSTYVPARNLIFLSFATAYAESIGASDLFIGVNSVDYSGYPDCRPTFIESFRKTAKLATCLADTNEEWQIHAPLQSLSKAEIILLATRLNVPLHLTHSCYNPASDGRSCGKCDSCFLRHQGFLNANIPDPTHYI